MLENSAPPPDAPEVLPPDSPSPAGAFQRRRGGRWALPLTALITGLVIGGATGASIALASSDPAQSEEYRAVLERAQAAETRAEEAEAATERAGRRIGQRNEELLAREKTVMTREQELTAMEAAVAAREQAVTAVEQQIAARSIGPGIWTVGVDIEPGTYRAAQPVSSDCYWAITRSGTNGSDIIDNDIPGGGIPTVTLQAGQDFVNNRCGTFVKQ